jgi:hypothetical protein
MSPESKIIRLLLGESYRDLCSASPPPSSFITSASKEMYSSIENRHSAQSLQNSSTSIASPFGLAYNKTISDADSLPHIEALLLCGQREEGKLQMTCLLLTLCNGRSRSRVSSLLFSGRFSRGERSVGTGSAYRGDLSASDIPAAR